MRRRLWWITGLVLVVGGLSVVLASRTGPGEFGWFAYTPLSHGNDLWSSSTSRFFVSRWQLVGAAATAVGLVVLAAGIGYRLGRRTGDRPSAEPG